VRGRGKGEKRRPEWREGPKRRNRMRNGTTSKETPRQTSNEKRPAKKTKSIFRFNQFFLHWNGAEKDESWKQLLGATETGPITRYESPQKPKPTWMKVGREGRKKEEGGRKKM
jgi:hypothetical protein